MKLFYLLILLTISGACSALELRLNKMSSASLAITQNGFVKASNVASILPVHAPAFKSFDILDSSTSNTLVISALSLADIAIHQHYSNTSISSPSGGINEYGYFTEFQLTLKSDLMITGQWTRLHDSYNDGYDSKRLLRPVEWSLATESRSSTAREVGLNWTVFDGLQAFAKLQTVNGSAWIPQVSVPRFVTQDSEHWTLAAIELVYTF